jgi:four helix bundle protein
MPKYQKFEEVPAWRESARLYSAVLDLLEYSPSPFSPGFRHQLERAALAVSSNIAEGFERGGRPESLQCLGMARAAASEIRSMMAVVFDRPRLKEHGRQLEQIRTLSDSCARQVGAWIRSVEEGRRVQAEGSPADVPPATEEAARTVPQRPYRGSMSPPGPPSGRRA